MDLTKFFSTQKNNAYYIILKDYVDNSPFKRDIENELKKWLSYFSNNILYLKGPRQIGKTSELIKFGTKNFKEVIYINLVDDNKNEFVEILNTSLSNFIDKFKTYIKDKFDINYNDNAETLLIIDEIQSKPFVYEHLKLLNKILNCKIAVTGSYLGHLINMNSFTPIGSLYPVEMNTLNFKEFCRIFDKEDILINSKTTDKNSDLEELYNLYKTIGGYPKIINFYLSNKKNNELTEEENLELCKTELNILIESFLQESTKYFTDINMYEVFKHSLKGALLFMLKDKKGAANNILEDITKFTKENKKVFVNKTEINNSISWLINCGLINFCNGINLVSLEESFDRKIYFSDCSFVKILSENLLVDTSNIEGLLTETFVFNEIKKYKPRFGIYDTNEIDFLVKSKNNKIIIIEAKTSNNEHKSLSTILNKKSEIIDKAIYAGINDTYSIEKLNNIPYYRIPIYMLGTCLKNLL